MTYDDVLRHFGGLTRASAALGLPTSTVGAWLRRGVPIARQWQLWALTGGALVPSDYAEARARYAAATGPREPATSHAGS